MNHTNRSTLAGTDRMNERRHFVDAVAEHPGVARDAVYRWIEHKALPAHRLSRLWKFRLPRADDQVRCSGADENDGNPGAQERGWSQ
jgi:hypothetical protein